MDSHDAVNVVLVGQLRVDVGIAEGHEERDDEDVEKLHLALVVFVGWKDVLACLDEWCGA
jgi:hypothetical protein